MYDIIYVPRYANCKYDVFFHSMDDDQLDQLESHLKVSDEPISILIDGYTATIHKLTEEAMILDQLAPESQDLAVQLNKLTSLRAALNLQGVLELHKEFLNHVLQFQQEEDQLQQILAEYQTKLQKLTAPRTAAVRKFVRIRAFVTLNPQAPVYFPPTAEHQVSTHASPATSS